MRRFLPIGLDWQLIRVVYTRRHRLPNAILFRHAFRHSGTNTGLRKIRRHLPTPYATSCNGFTLGCFRCAA